MLIKAKHEKKSCDMKKNRIFLVFFIFLFSFFVSLQLQFNQALVIGRCSLCSRSKGAVIF